MTLPTGVLDFLTALKTEGKAALVAVVEKVGTDTQTEIPTLEGDLANAALDFIPSGIARTIVAGILSGAATSIDAAALSTVKNLTALAVARIEAL